MQMGNVSSHKNKVHLSEDAWFSVQGKKQPQNAMSYGSPMTVMTNIVAIRIETRSSANW
jgi:hypothetical protein